MTIRYACEKCGSVLKIKEDRIGKEGHCPKCKTVFVVPPEDTAPPAEPPAKVSVPADDAKPPVPPASPDADGDFDPVEFLMTGGPEKSAPRTANRPEPVSAAGEAPDMRVKRGSKSASYTASDEPDIRVGGPRNVTSAAAEEELATQLRNRKPKNAAAPSASKSADEMLRVNAAASSAKELMSKTVEESRIRAAQMPEERGKPGVDYKATGRELFLRFAPYVGGFVLLIVFAHFFGNLMVGPSIPLPELGRVSGKVTKAGNPLVDARINFQPIDNEDAGASSAYTDENGDYELNYIEGVKGVALGKCKVEVSLIGKDGRDIIRPQTPYGIGSNDVVTVEEGSQTINIEIP